MKDVRNLGMVAGIELESRDGAPARGLRSVREVLRGGCSGALYKRILAFSPPLIIEDDQIEQIFSTVRKVLETVK